ncbi:ABC-2 type transport system ATP-binding protein [Lentzea xinjiangensis]|uniref:ABC-2 type transport system ATP-binding protein n=1 Tax=Lentzea xinjiangensis TaxID=402600 RepID=A0A1H9SY84_9PSEU|nr:ATP-binding cassette domain-containing protein [Lentzea xinjiangensis]SER89399.1 ABC-2 type transport system ATP-binding protein [Lentzea xinjiangensis]
MSTHPFAIETTGLRKSYGDKVVLDGVDLRVPAGTIFSLLGPNGAGKTTAVNILTTLLRADGGEVRVAGHDVAREPDAVRKAISVTGQFAAVDNLLTGWENLLLVADLHRLGKREGRALATRLLEQFDLVDAAKVKALAYSGGMRRRLDLAMTLVGGPSLIFLDEPTTGLDPRSRHSMWQIIRDLVAGGTTIFLTTQYLEEADELADRIAVLDGGKLVAEGTADELKQRVPGSYIRLRFADGQALRAGAAALAVPLPETEELTLKVPNDGGVRALRTVLDRLDDASVEAEELTVHTPDLDDVFLALTDRKTVPQGATR